MAVTVMVLAAVKLIAPGSSSPSYETGDEIIEAMAEGGVDCVGVEVDMDPETFGPTPLEEFHCKIEGESVEGEVFRDSGALANYMGIAESMGCEVAGAFGMTDIYVVVGEQWSVTPESETVADRIADAIGGTVRKLC